MSWLTGALKPAFISTCDSVSTRKLRLPSGSPSVKRLPSITRTKPGSINSAAGYTTPPTTRSGSMCRAIAPSGSTLDRQRPS